MSVLLDTHYVYAIAGAPGRLSAGERKYLSERPDPFVVSAVSLWEIRLKWSALYKSGGRKGPIGPAQVLQVLRTQNVDFLPMTTEHAVAALHARLDHKDPFDELLLLQAQAENLRLLTRDAKLAAHPLAIRAG